MIITSWSEKSVMFTRLLLLINVILKQSVITFLSSMTLLRKWLVVSGLMTKVIFTFSCNTTGSGISSPSHNPEKFCPMNLSIFSMFDSPPCTQYRSISVYSSEYRLTFGRVMLDERL